MELSGLGNTGNQQIQALVQGKFGDFRLKGGANISMDVYEAYKSNNDITSLLKETEFTIQFGIEKNLGITGTGVGGELSFGFQGKLSEFEDWVGKNNPSDLLSTDGQGVYDIFSAY